ncbi:hypothetical protein [Paraburkholderia sp. BR13444]|uniref:hypothetical protein n=1 Tax=Paraburkholderia sp. BR13444 TaxID=3236997 RepID=UPI0034CE7336
MEDVALERAAEAAIRRAWAMFNAHRFVDELYGMSFEPSESVVKALVARCGGTSDCTFDLLKDIGVVEQSWRMLREGVAPPWLQ